MFSQKQCSLFLLQSPSSPFIFHFVTFSDSFGNSIAFLVLRFFVLVCFTLRGQRLNAMRLSLPHDPGHQHHGGLVERVEELDEDLSFLAQLPQRHTKHDGKHDQTENIHPILVLSKRHLKTQHA